MAAESLLQRVAARLQAGTQGDDSATSSGVVGRPAAGDAGGKQAEADPGAAAGGGVNKWIGAILAHLAEGEAGASAAGDAAAAASASTEGTHGSVQRPSVAAWKAALDRTVADHDGAAVFAAAVLQEVTGAEAGSPHKRTTTDSSSGAGKAAAAPSTPEAAASTRSKRKRDDGVSPPPKTPRRAEDGPAPVSPAPVSSQVAAPATSAELAQAFVSRDEVAKREEDSGVLTFQVITNDGVDQHMIWLVQLKNIFSQQLPKMPKAYIVRLMFDRRHKSLIALKNGVLVGGVCFRPFDGQTFAEIAFLAVSSKHQVKGYGTRVMNQLKEAAKPMGITHLLTFADNYAIGYFKKQGFTKNISLPRELWGGYIKEYDGGTLMECAILKEVCYTDVPRMVQSQRDALFQRLVELSASRIVYPGLDHTYDDPYEVPGMKNAGWATTETARKLELKGAQLKEQLVSLLGMVQRHDDSWPFKSPVDPVEVPDYYQVITDPIDLSTIQKRLDSGHFYKSVDMFQAELQRMVDNCRKYNPQHSQYFKCAVRLESFFQHRIRQLRTSGPTPADAPVAGAAAATPVARASKN